MLLHLLYITLFVLTNLLWASKYYKSKAYQKLAYSGLFNLKQNESNWFDYLSDTYHVNKRSNNKQLLH